MQIWSALTKALLICILLKVYSGRKHITNPVDLFRCARAQRSPIVIWAALAIGSDKMRAIELSSKLCLFAIYWNFIPGGNIWLACIKNLIDIMYACVLLYFVVLDNACMRKVTLRSLINVQSLITVQGVTLFYKKFKVSSGLGHFPFLRP